MQKKEKKDFLVELGHSEEEALVKRLRFRLAMQIEKAIENNGWNQTQAAEKLHIPQSRVSNLLNGHIEKFSLDMLIELYDRIGGQISITLKETAASAA